MLILTGFGVPTDDSPSEDTAAQPSRICGMECQPLNPFEKMTFIELQRQLRRFSDGRFVSSATSWNAAYDKPYPFVALDGVIGPNVVLAISLLMWEIFPQHKTNVWGDDEWQVTMEYVEQLDQANVADHAKKFADIVRAFADEHRLPAAVGGSGGVKVSDDVGTGATSSTRWVWYAGGAAALVGVTVLLYVALRR